MKNVLIAAAGALLAAPAFAQVVDGANFQSEYGPALWAQNVGTGFGNNTDPSRDFANGSEINALYARVVGGTLYLGVAGNLETNFNKLAIFVDFMDGGQNQLRGDNADVDFNGLNRMSGLRFDAGFAADLFLGYGGGNNPAEHYANAATLPSGGAGMGAFLGGGNKNDVGAINGMLGGAGISVDGDNSNILGVAGLGSPFDSDPGSVTTGFEWAIDLAALGWDGSSEIRIAGFVIGGGYDFMSNQILGGLPDGWDNLGEVSMIDFSTIDGLQYIVIPTPSAAALLGLGSLAALRRRR